VPGVEQYIRENTHQQDYVLVSATPDDELLIILKELDIDNNFSEIYGASLCKKNAIEKVLKARNINSLDCVMVGDAIADMEAAEANKVKFVLRKHSSNIEPFKNYDVLTVENFNTL
jgi:HAD superfamily hydrolase (TIGR01549 family)